MRESRFAAYVDAARNGKNALWRIILSVVIIAVIWAVISLVFVYAAAVFILIRDGIWPGSFSGVFELIGFADLSSDRIWPFVMLLSIAPLWLAVWLAVKVVHRRPLHGLFGVEGRLYWSDFARSALVTLVVGCVTAPIALLIDPTIVRGSVSLSSWLAMAPLLLVSLFLQTSAEEVVFRGYLHQTLAARFATPLIWLAVPTVLFTAMHWQSGASTAMNLAGLFVILGFSLSMSCLLMASGNLAAAMGAHLANNIGAVMLFSYQPDLGSAALFMGRSILDPGWTPTQAVMFALYGALVVAVTQLLLLHRSSPVRLRSLP
ncbi:CPBP family intramembrane glutamic endopeptidase [Bosea sp. NPDC055332]